MGWGSRNNRGNMRDMKKLIAAALVGLTLSAGAGAVEAEPVAVEAEVVEVVEARPEAGCYYKHWYANVERWHATAINAGWTECQWYRLSCVIYRESRGNPMAWNKADPGRGSVGLTQINSVHWGWMARAGLIRWPYDLFTGSNNLAAAKALYVRAGGWSPWGSCG